ncbi:MAG: polyamine ABC transporter ATP-binding protein [Rhodobacterales bacterium]|nr:MAG: polyamine ABC transporter ATP-binding protein [Rhodobacterales bacterium]
MNQPQRISEGAKPWIDQSQKPFIQISNISKKFSSFVAVDNVSLDIYREELFCLLGGSGCGKTTLLRMLAGFEAPTSGNIRIDGQDMVDVPPNKRPTNMMFQSYALFPHMSVEKNIGYGLRRDGMSASETADRVAEMIKLVQLEGFGRRKPNQLSGGQQQRVALARSLIKRPKLLLLDEPLGALDKKLRQETQFELINIQERLGVTFIVVTHDQEEAMTLASRIGVMDKGRLIQVGEPREIYEFPQSRFVADFIGSVNLFEGRVDEDSINHVRIHCDETENGILVSHGISCGEHQKLWIAVRPEKMQITLEKPDQDHNVVKGVVDEIAYLGHQSVFRVRLPSGRFLRMAHSNLSRHQDTAISWDDVVYLTWAEDAAVVLTR